MTSRDAILKAIREQKPPPVPLPDVPAFAAAPPDLVPLFQAALHRAGGQVCDVSGTDTVAAVLAAHYPDVSTTCSLLPEYAEGSMLPGDITDPHDLAGIDLLLCAGTLGVAENGAIWMTESMVLHRAAPFITQHLAIVLDRRALVENMHAAYARLRIRDEGYGVFIAGPSKTADIEQALVVGAHGPRSLTVLLR